MEFARPGRRHCHHNTVAGPNLETGSGIRPAFNLHVACLYEAPYLGTCQFYTGMCKKEIKPFRFLTLRHLYIIRECVFRMCHEAAAELIRNGRSLDLENGFYAFSNLFFVLLLGNGYFLNKQISGSVKHLALAKGKGLVHLQDV